MADRNDPYRNCRFELSLGNIKEAAFSEATIADTAQDPIEYRDGNEAPTVRKIPGLIKYGNLTLKKGITDDSQKLFDWRKQVEDGKMKEARQEISLTLLDEEGQPKAEWTFTQAWPTKYDAPDFNAKGTDIAIETLEIAHEGMVRTK